LPISFVLSRQNRDPRALEQHLDVLTAQGQLYHIHVSGYACTLAWTMIYRG